MSQRDALLDLERRKLGLLRQKLAEQERKVKTLEAMDDDPFDALLERELGLHTAHAATLEVEPVRPPQPAKTPEPEPAAAGEEVLNARFNWGAELRRPRRIPRNWVRLLRFIGPDGKTYDQVTAFIAESKFAITPGAARTQLMNYRKDFGFIENPSKGFYKATERALGFLDTQEGEDPAVGTGGVFSLQPNPLDRAAA